MEIIVVFRGCGKILFVSRSRVHIIVVCSRYVDIIIVSPDHEKYVIVSSVYEDIVIVSHGKIMNKYPPQYENLIMVFRDHGKTFIISRGLVFIIVVLRDRSKVSDNLPLLNRHHCRIHGRVDIIIVSANRKKNLIISCVHEGIVIFSHGHVKINFPC